MSIRHTVIKGVALSTLSLLLLAAAPAGAPASTTTTRGTAATTSVPLHVEALTVPIDLGRLVMTATTDGEVTDRAPWSAIQLTLADIGGARFGEVAVSSDGTTSSGGLAIDRDTLVGPIAASTANVLATANDSAGTATAALTTLTTEATVLTALDLQATVSNALTSVGDTGAAATHTLTLAEIDLDLAHVLGSVLGTLPLQDLIAIADALGVEVPANIGAAGEVVTATEELLAAVAAAATAAADVDTAAQALLDADDGTLAALQSLQDDIDALITAGTLDVTTVNALIAILSDPLLSSCGLTPDILTLGQDLLDAAACVEGLIDDHLGTLTDELTALEGAVQRYLDAVADAVAAAGVLEGESSSLSDIVDEITTLLADLLDADLLALDGIEVSQQVRAVGGQLDASSATNTCQVTGLRALGGEPIEIVNCDGGANPLTAAITLITTTLGQVLDTVGGVDAGDGVALELFNTAESTVTEDADGWVRATSVMEVLALTVPDITVTPCDVEVAGDLVCALGLDLDGLLGDALDGVDGVLTTAHATVTGALTGVSELLAALDSPLPVDAADGAQAIVDRAVEALKDVLDGLNLGDLGTGGGATVPGARIVVDPSLEAEHQVVTAAADPGSPADPADPAPGDPGDDPTLPNTGGGAALLAILAMGAGAWLWRRREVE